jgi:uncharacterized membrane protein
VIGQAKGGIVMIKGHLAAAVGIFAASCGHAEQAAAPLSVYGVSENDTLRMRAGPSASAAEVGSIPPNGDGIEPGDPTDNLNWLSVTYKGKTGFVNTSFLAYGAHATRDRLPVRLQCSGTEPFWAIDVGYHRAFANLLFSESKAELSLADPETSRGFASPWLLRGAGDEDANFLLIDAEKCSDGMSDTQYSYSLNAQLGGVLLKGCCEQGSGR